MYLLYVQHCDKTPSCFHVNMVLRFALPAIRIFHLAPCALHLAPLALCTFLHFAPRNLFFFSFFFFSLCIFTLLTPHSSFIGICILHLVSCNLQFAFCKFPFLLGVCVCVCDFRVYHYNVFPWSFRIFRISLLFFFSPTSYIFLFCILYVAFCILHFEFCILHLF